jgi:hypothetical protein
MRIGLALALGALLVGCNRPRPVEYEELQVVTLPASAEEQDPAWYAWTARARLSAGEEQVEAWLPLPAERPEQRLRTLVWELGPEASAEVLDLDGAPVLHVRAPGGAEVLVRASVEHALPQALPARVDGLVESDAAAWVQAAAEAGAEARLTPAVTGGASAEPTLVAEVRVDGAWRAVDPAQGRLALPANTVLLTAPAARETRGEAPVELALAHRLAPE